MRHKHADLIHAWAEGAEIEYKPVDVSIWKDCGDLEPSWGNDFFEYRIKPEKKPDVVRTIGMDVTSSGRLCCVQLQSPNFGDRWQHAIKLTFCGETGKLLRAEVL